MEREHTLQDPSVEQLNKRVRTHPILNKEQQAVVIDCLRSDKDAAELANDHTFMASFPPQMRIRMEYLLARSASAAEVLIGCNDGLVRKIALKYYQISIDQAVSAGNIGLVKAAMKWDPEKGAKLSTYAVWDIRSEIQKAVREITFLSERDILDIHHAKRILNVFATLFEREASADELQQQLLANTNLSPRRVTYLVDLMKSENILFLGREMNGETNTVLADFVADSTVDVAQTALNNVSNENLRHKIKSALQILSDDEQTVIRGRFGLGDSVQKEATELASELNITVDQIEQLYVSALLKLQKIENLQQESVSMKADADPSGAELRLEDLTHMSTRQKVLHFRQRGMNNGAEISRLIGYSIKRVNQLTRELVRDGVIPEPILPGEKRRADIKALRLSGLYNDQIAQRLGIPLVRVTEITRLWERAKEIESIADREARIKAAAVSDLTIQVSEYLEAERKSRHSFKQSFRAIFGTGPSES